MAPIDPTSPATSWVSFIPGPAARILGLVILTLIPAFYLVRFALPSCRITDMDKSLHTMRILYHKAVDNHWLNFQLGAHLAIRNKFNECDVLDDEARELRIKMLQLHKPPGFWWWNELTAVGLSRAIVRCTCDIKILKNEIQWVSENAQHNLNLAAAIGLSPVQQVWLRRQSTLDAENV
ncbi:hypothetical protein C8F04DRAFT_1081154 [Mycena alexandri]|uniref:Uncharacterized protein n=1 Tax=Mycena alexandri TaxID=1745969 RepID=A0AAD6XD71_9AGAR|nr:hypothetical protein C8F04DRAFT_1081154 [Mycena alexandri]